MITNSKGIYGYDKVKIQKNELLSSKKILKK